MNRTASELLDVLTHECEVEAAVFRVPTSRGGHRTEIVALGHDGQRYRVEADDGMGAVLLLAGALEVDLSDV